MNRGERAGTLWWHIAIAIAISVLTAILLFPVARCCHNYLRTLWACRGRKRIDFVTWIIIILIFDPFCQISQHERKSFKTNPYVFDVMPNNFRCTDWRQDCCILYPVYIQEKSRNSPAERWTETFTWFKTWARGLLPQRSTRVKIISSSITRLLVIYLQTRFCHTLAVLYSRSRTSMLYFMLKIVCVRRVQRYISVTSPTSSTWRRTVNR